MEQGEFVGLVQQVVVVRVPLIRSALSAAMPPPLAPVAPSALPCGRLVGASALDAVYDEDRGVCRGGGGDLVRQILFCFLVDSFNPLRRIVRLFLFPFFSFLVPKALPNLET